MSSPTAQPPGKAFASMTKLSVPIVSAPMAGVSGGDLAASVARAGGLGFIGAGMMSNAEQLQRYSEAPTWEADTSYAMIMAPLHSSFKTKKACLDDWKSRSMLRCR